MTTSEVITLVMVDITEAQRKLDEHQIYGRIDDVDAAKARRVTKVLAATLNTIREIDQ